ACSQWGRAGDEGDLTPSALTLECDGLPPLWAGALWADSLLPSPHACSPSLMNGCCFGGSKLPHSKVNAYGTQPPDPLPCKGRGDLVSEGDASVRYPGWIAALLSSRRGVRARARAAVGWRPFW